MLWELQKKSNHFEPFSIEMQIGNEVLNTYFENELFYVSAMKNKELEEEITNKLKVEFDKKYPKTCPQFPQRLYKR